VDFVAVSPDRRLFPPPVRGGQQERLTMQQTLEHDALTAAGIAKPVIFFDDVCNMCNGFVNLILRIDRRQRFLFAPLTGKTARKLLPPLPDDPGKWSMVYLDESGIHDESDASLEVYRRLGGPWWLLSLARFVPRVIRNPVYRVIAGNRYRWFGKRETCRIPTAEERARFLD
jgi:predicted DCC family thiol-disulfide oxidoreductase YuxK